MANVELLEKIPHIHKESDGTHGAPQVHAELRAQGIEVSLNWVARLMRGGGAGGREPTEGTKTTVRGEEVRPAPDLVDRDFTATGPDQVWVADITYIPTGWFVPKSTTAATAKAAASQIGSKADEVFAEHASQTARLSNPFRSWIFPRPERGCGRALHSNRILAPWP